MYLPSTFKAEVACIKSHRHTHTKKKKKKKKKKTTNQDYLKALECENIMM